MRRIGIFGGSFNPPHYGHLLAAQAAFERLKLDELRFIPCRKSAYGKKLLPGSKRLRLLKLAVGAHAGFQVDPIELKRPGISRSIDTLRELRERLGREVRFFLLIGEDQALAFPHWKEAENLSRLATVVVLSRPPFQCPQALKRRYRFRILPIPKIEISSALIWQRKRAGLSLKWLCPDFVIKAI